jgi:hypothetical protein
LGLARQAPARQCAPVANLRNILWPPAHSTYWVGFFNLEVACCNYEDRDQSLLIATFT